MYDGNINSERKRNDAEFPTFKEKLTCDFIKWMIVVIKLLWYNIFESNIMVISVFRI